MTWEYYPTEVTPKYGLLMGGTKDLLSSSPSLFIPVCLAKLYAMKHNYAFAFHDNLGTVKKRKYGKCSSHQMAAWNKIPLMEKYLKDVEILVWLDLDALIQRMDITLDQILPSTWDQGACNSYSDPRELGTGIDLSDPGRLPGSASEPFLWVTLDINVNYTVNVNTAVMAVRRGPLGFKFLRQVWEEGEDPNLFKRYDINWAEKNPCVGYWGWPWEQGGVWSVLQNAQHIRYLQGSCVLPHRGESSLNSVYDQWRDGIVARDRPFILHNPSGGFDYWLAYLLRINTRSRGHLEQFCHPSVGKRYVEILEQLRNRKEEP